MAVSLSLQRRMITFKGPLLIQVNFYAYKNYLEEINGKEGRKSISCYTIPRKLKAEMRFPEYLKLYK